GSPQERHTDPGGSRRQRNASTATATAATAATLTGGNRVVRGQESGPRVGVEDRSRCHGSRWIEAAQPECRRAEIGRAAGQPGELLRALVQRAGRQAVSSLDSG